MSSLYAWRRRTRRGDIRARGAHSRTSNTGTKLLIYSLFQKGRVLAQDGVPVVDEVSLAKEETIPHVSEVSCHLLHPLPVGVRRYPTDAHAASGDIDDKQDMVADEPERVHNLDGEQVCRSDGAPMSARSRQARSSIWPPLAGSRSHPAAGG